MALPPAGSAGRGVLSEGVTGLQTRGCRETACTGGGCRGNMDGPGTSQGRRSDVAPMLPRQSWTRRAAAASCGRAPAASPPCSSSPAAPSVPDGETPGHPSCLHIGSEGVPAGQRRERRAGAHVTHAVVHTRQHPAPQVISGRAHAVHMVIHRGGERALTFVQQPPRFIGRRGPRSSRCGARLGKAVGAATTPRASSGARALRRRDDRRAHQDRDPAVPCLRLHASIPRLT